ncbi:glycoside hydrolase family 2 TIM barrel-domain containing protein [Kushneria indalinina]|uniref:glycoside hydrolase family 2 TIM barrel-domain containing protein n=1 Tax=Kushneria indalinina TaxID=184067 RepID=UPI000E220FED|nr:glycoside hydrolase family 2 TIM barrel-domain containing protein [Kushneria indalinina]
MDSNHRPTHYEGGGADTAATDIICPMYARVGEDQFFSGARRYAIERWIARPGETRPLILCEYAHAMGNSLGSLDRYWAAFRKYPRLQGGFIWDWVDQSLLKTVDGQQVSAYGGDFGDMPNDHRFCMNGLVFADRSPHPSLYEAAHLQQPFRFHLVSTRPLVIDIESEWQFRPTNNESLYWRVHRDGVTLAEGQQGLAIAPGERWQSRLDGVPEHDGQPGEWWLNVDICHERATAWAEAGTRYAGWQQRLHASAEPAVPASRPQREAASLDYWHDGEQLHISTGDQRWTFDMSTARLCQWQQAGRDLLHTPLTDHFQRAPVDNDLGNNSGENSDKRLWVERWSEAGLDRLQHLAEPLQVVQGKEGIRVSAVHRYQVDERTVLISRWSHHFNPEGIVVIDIEVQRCSDLPSPARIGMTCELVDIADSVAWLGAGPHENYPDRSSASRVDHWQRPLADMHTDYVHPCDNGLRCNARWIDLGAWHIEGPVHFSVSRYGRECLRDATHRHLLQPSAGVHLCLDGFHMGVGGHDSWTPSVDADYLLLDDRLSYRVSLARQQAGEPPHQQGRATFI